MSLKDIRDNPKLAALNPDPLACWSGESESPLPPQFKHIKSGWRTVGGQRFYARSRWEANYARYLQFLKENKNIKKWRHEPKTFWFKKIKRGVRSYLPDFEVTTLLGHKEYHEVKGWMDRKSKTKLKRMAKYYPEVKISVVGPSFFKGGNALAKVISDWE